MCYGPDEACRIAVGTRALNSLHTEQHRQEVLPFGTYTVHAFVVVITEKKLQLSPYKIMITFQTIL